MQAESLERWMYRQDGSPKPEVMANLIPDAEVRRLLLHRVCAGWGWAVHGLVFDFMETRTGTLLQNDTSRADISSIAACKRRLRFDTGWFETAAEGGLHFEAGDRIVRVRGHGLDPSAPHYLCYDLELTFGSGAIVHYSGVNPQWMGEPFEFALPSPTSVVRDLVFDEGTVAGLECVQSSLFLALSPDHHHLLPAAVRASVVLILKVAERINRERAAHDLPALSNDVWMLILSKLRGLDLVVAGCL